ncbi:peptide MFS transporter [Methanobacterium alcaliphilum]|uniref:peptide MFS transporter n=1 Tax=Methanobacterium alcaliphilum TaxID=392018 RepID=UPI00200AD901|nr:peptide MFS transporter [Methanobacterium alcaliphilum]MCK9150588.1 peptide MFS transporter [Methanobacterium alcaliphilum]
MWERFSYYGMRAILSLYMLKALLFSIAFTSTIYGYYTGLVYLTPLIGGYVADRYWGNRKSIIIGAILMALGQFSLATSSYFYNPSLSNTVSHSYLFNNQEIFFLIGLFLLIMGNGFFKPNISSMVGSLYEKNDKKRDSAFTIFYMGINLGALLSPLVIGGIGDTGNPADFIYGFLAAGVGMILGLLVFIFSKDKYLVSPSGKKLGIFSDDRNQFNQKEIVLDQRGNLKTDINTFIDKPLTLIEKQRIGVIFILSFFVIFFWTAFEQAGVSLTFFAQQNVDRILTFCHWTIPASWFQSINPMAILIFAPLFATLWPLLNQRKLEPSIPSKMAIGLLLLSLGFLILTIPAGMIDQGFTAVSPLWLIAIYVMFTFGELCISPIGLSMVSKLSPVRFISFMMGVWFLSAAASNIMAGLLSALYPDPNTHITPHLFGFAITGFHDFFMIFVLMSAISAFILILIRKKLVKMMHGIV